MKRIIVADDEPVTRMDLLGILPELGFEVVGEASDGFDAIELCKEQKPDLVLIDVKMPIFDRKIGNMCCVIDCILRQRNRMACQPNWRDGISYETH